MTATTSEEDNLKVFCLPEELCQSHEEDSKACTLIVVLVIHNCYKAKLNFSASQLSQNLINAFAKSINEGNMIYRQLQDSGVLKVKYLNIPEALQAVGSYTNTPVVEWESFYYDTDITRSLHYNLSKKLDAWQKTRPSDAQKGVSVIILANLRAVVLMFSDSGIVTLLDSHSHCPYGAVVALAPSSFLAAMCHWYAKQLTKDTGPVSCYELSFLYCR